MQALISKTHMPISEYLGLKTIEIVILCAKAQLAAQQHACVRCN